MSGARTEGSMSSKVRPPRTVSPCSSFARTDCLHRAPLTYRNVVYMCARLQTILLCCTMMHIQTWTISPCLLFGRNFLNCSYCVSLSTPRKDTPQTRGTAPPPPYLPSPSQNKPKRWRSHTYCRPLELEQQYPVSYNSGHIFHCTPSPNQITASSGAPAMASMLQQLSPSMPPPIALTLAAAAAGSEETGTEAAKGSTATATPAAATATTNPSGPFEESWSLSNQ